MHTGPQASQTIMGTAVNHYAAIDVSLELSSVCIVDATGKVVKETKVETRPEALVKLFKAFWPSLKSGSASRRVHSRSGFMRASRTPASRPPS